MYVETARTSWVRLRNAMRPRYAAANLGIWNTNLKLVSLKYRMLNELRPTGKGT